MCVCGGGGGGGSVAICTSLYRTAGRNTIFSFI